MSLPSVVQYIPFGGNVYARLCSISWSENNVIAFCTEEGLYLMEPFIHTFSVDASFPIPIHKQFIASSEQSKVFDFEFDRQNLVIEAPREEVFELMLDRTLSSAVACSQSHKGFRQSEWSPIGLGPKETCVLAALTADHRLVLYVNWHEKWSNIADVSDLYYEHLKHNNYEMPWKNDCEETESNSEKMKEFKKKCYAVAATYVVWSHIMTSGESDSNRFCLLAVGMKDGSVVIWKIRSITRCTTTSDELTVVGVVDGTVGMIKSLCWIQLNSHSGLLVIGGLTGKIKVFDVSIDDKDSLKAFEAFSLWKDEDKIQVNLISHIKISDDLFAVVASKSNFVIAWKITRTSVKEMVHKSGNYIQSLIGLFSNNDDEFFAASADGVVVRVKLDKLKCEGLNLTLEGIMSDRKSDYSNMYGMVSSPNRFLFSLLEGISSWHDHLVIREPYKLLVVISENLDGVALRSVLERMDHSESKIHSFADVLHSVHYYWFRHGKYPESLAVLMELSHEDQRQLSTCKLQLLRWLFRLAIFSEKEDEAVQYKLGVQNVETLLIERQLLLVLNKIDKCKDFKQLSVKTVLVWLNERQKLLDEDDKNLLRRILERMNLESKITIKTELEECRLCKSTICFENLHYGKCRNGHTFGRCFLSLSLCDLPNYEKCRNCSILARKDFMELLEDARCPFCSKML